MNHITQAGIERGKQIYRDRASPDPAELMTTPGIVIGYMWQAGFEHAYDGHRPKFTEPSYEQGYGSGLQARRRYRDQPTPSETTYARC